MVPSDCRYCILLRKLDVKVYHFTVIDINNVLRIFFNIIFFAPTSTKTTIITGVTSDVTGVWNNCSGDSQSFWYECWFHVISCKYNCKTSRLFPHSSHLRVSLSMKGWKTQIINDDDQMIIYVYFHDFYYILKSTFKRRRRLSSILFEYLWHTLWLWQTDTAHWT